MSTVVSAGAVRYIKLGRHGGWEKECIDHGIIRLGFGTAKPSRFRLCQRRDWDKLKKSFLDEGNTPGKATEFTNEIRHFWEDDGTTLWITFYGGKMHWGFLDPNPPECHSDGDGIWRTVANRWRADDLKGMALSKTRLSKALTNYAMFPGTSCNVKVKVADYVIRRIKRGSRTSLNTAGQGSRGVEDSVVEALERIRAKSHGFLLDSKLRKALEDHAMEAAKRHFVALGYKWDDHSKTRSYDLRCSRNHEVLYVEVKGTQTDGREIILTPGEVEFARSHQRQMCLFVLHSIQVSDGEGESVLSGGKLHLILPWDVNLGTLKPVSFKYDLSSSGAG